MTQTPQTERSLVLVKPDGYRRGLSGEVLRRIEAKGYALVALAVVTPTQEQLAEHYAEHEGKPFYEPLVEFMMSGPVTAVRLPRSSYSCRQVARPPGSVISTGRLREL